MTRLWAAGRSMAPMTSAQRQRRRARLRGTTSQVSPSANAVSTSPDLGRSDHTTDTPVVVDLSLVPERIAARVFAAVPHEKADAIAKSINQRLAVWRCGSFDLRLVPRR